MKRTATCRVVPWQLVAAAAWAVLLLWSLVKSAAVVPWQSYGQEQSTFCSGQQSDVAKPAPVEVVNRMLQKLGDQYTAVFHRIPDTASISNVPFVQYMYAGRTDYISAQFATEGTVPIWEEHVVRQLHWAMNKLTAEQQSKDAKEKPVFLDIGGNIGTMTLQMATAGFEVLFLDLRSKPSNRLAITRVPL